MARRRPADIYLPCFRGAPTALDLAITACQRMDSLGEAGRRGGAAAASYKARHLNTAEACPPGCQVPADGAGQHGGLGCRGPDPAESRPRCCRAGGSSSRSCAWLLAPFGPVLRSGARRSWAPRRLAARRGSRRTESIRHTAAVVAYPGFRSSGVIHLGSACCDRGHRHMTPARSCFGWCSAPLHMQLVCVLHSFPVCRLATHVSLSEHRRRGPWFPLCRCLMPRVHEIGSRGVCCLSFTRMLIGLCAFQAGRTIVGLKLPLFPSGQGVYT